MSASPTQTDVTAILASFVHLLPWIMVILLLPTLIKEIVSAIREFRA